MITLRTPGNWVTTQHSLTKINHALLSHSFYNSVSPLKCSLPEGRGIIAIFCQNSGKKAVTGSPPNFPLHKGYEPCCCNPIPTTWLAVSWKPPAEHSLGIWVAVHSSRFSECFSGPSYVGRYYAWKHANPSTSSLKYYSD